MLLEPLTEEQEDQVLAEIGYSREQLERDLLDIKEWLKKQHHLPPSKLTEKDSFLTLFLTGCKGRLDIVKRKLDAYYTFRTKASDIYCRDPLAEDYVAVKDMMNFILLPKVIESDIILRVFMISFNDPDTQRYNFLNTLKKIISTFELRLREDKVCVREIIVFDAKFLSYGHFMKTKLFKLKDLLEITQNIYPARFYKIFCINISSYIEMLFNYVIRPLLTKKIQKRIIITREGAEVLYEHCDKANLPADFGGNLPPLREFSERWHEKEAQKRDWYLNELSEQTDESKRKTSEDAVENPWKRNFISRNMFSH